MMTTAFPEQEVSTPVSAGEDDIRQYISEIRKFPRLTPEEERDLARLCAQGDENAIRQMVNCNLRLVVSVAREYAGRGVPLMDLIQEGSIGLLVAAKKFDYTLDYRFSTYATKWIRQGVTRCLMNHGCMIRVPMHTAERIRKITSVRNRLLQENGTEPDIQELAQHCDLPVEKVRRLLQLSPQTCSLDAPTTDEESTLGVLLEDVHTPQPQEKLVREELIRVMEVLLSMLTERQQQVLRLRFGMIDGTDHSQAETGAIIGISKERVRQVEHQAMEKLQKFGASMGLEDFLG